jgi:hypothetical protein
LTIWSDQKLESGDAWHDEISVQLEQVRAAVLLVSPAFLASKYIRNSELPVLLKHAKDRDVTIIPVILRHCLFNETVFKYPDPVRGPQELCLSVLQAANSPMQPLNALDESEQDKVLLGVAQRLHKLLEPPAFPTEIQSSRKIERTRGEIIGTLPPRNPFFTGREEIFLVVEEALRTEQTAVISGLGGLGKTEVAAEFVYRRTQTYERIFWVTAESQQILFADLSAIAAHLNLPGRDAPNQQDLVKQVVRWWNTQDGCGVRQCG